MGWWKELLFETVVTQVDTATPQDTMIVVERGNARWAQAEHLDYVESGSHEYLGQAPGGFHVIGERDNTVTKKGLLEGILSLL